ncbi:hypothetical protein [Armatimonas rosea]|uniref:Uncharacterized protein n=1 Tax=Armatimonas rosea TaxID=685828 RepID=A0A7W9SWY4_ARMRO|nr:hypothetical protein [Armatimonas rosea]MBB6053933.1 hypothetical protein [Armatimonas rosea]
MSQKHETPFQLVRGVKVADLSGVHEGYSLLHAQEGYWVFTVNVSAENLKRDFYRLAGEVSGRGFLVLERGTPKAVEEKLRKRPSDPLHVDVYYLDGQTWATVKPLIERFEETLFCDGEINFGYGSHVNNDEVFVGAYKRIAIYAVDPQKYETALRELGIPREDALRTVWDTLSPSNPGSRHALKDTPFTIQQVFEHLEPKGLHFAEHRLDRDP